jgi:hypothetical protein
MVAGLSPTQDLRKRLKFIAAAAAQALIHQDIALCRPQQGPHGGGDGLRIVGVYCLAERRGVLQERPLTAGMHRQQLQLFDAPPIISGRRQPGGGPVLNDLILNGRMKCAVELKASTATAFLVFEFR